MSIEEKLRRLVLCGVLGWAALVGVPMKPKEIVELMHQMNVPQCTQTIPGQNENGDDPLTGGPDASSTADSQTAQRSAS